MALPNDTSLKTLNFAFLGAPFDSTATKGSNLLETMNFAFQAQPFVSNDAGASSTTLTLEEDAAVSDSATLTITIAITEGAAATDLASSSVLVQFEEDAGASDVVTALNITKTMEEGSAITDSAFTNPTIASDAVGVSDSLAQTITISITEGATATDSETLSVTLPIMEGAAATDSVVTSRLIAFEEGVGIKDSVLSFIFDQTEVGITTQIYQFDPTNAGIDTVVYEYVNDQSTIQNSVLGNALISTTSASSGSNPFQPTLIINGVVIYSNPSTLPPAGTANARAFVNFNCSTAISGINLSDIYNFSINFDDAGGTFTIISKTSFAALGDSITIFGFSGCVTKLGRDRSNSADGYITSGIFGSRSLNKQLAFEYSQIPYVQLVGLLPNQSLFVPSSAGWTTHASAVQGIGAIAGVSIQWTANDFMLMDFFPQAGQKAMDALSSLANEVGAKLRWNGSNKYVVAYPDQVFGAFTIPSCNLISAGGIQYTQLLDLETGISGQGVTVLPYFPPQTGAQSTQIGPTTSLGPPPVQQIGSIRKNLQSSDPPQEFPLPDNYNKIYLQCVTHEDAGGADYVTLDPTIWRPIEPLNVVTSDVSSPYYGSSSSSDLISGTQGINIVTRVFNNGLRTNKLVVDYNLFNNLSPNSDVQANNFVLNVGCTTNNLNAAFIQQQQESQDQGKYVVAREQERYRFIKTYEGTINAIFFGSIPVPGMWGSATIGDLTVQGIIESVNFVYPGYISCTVVQYKRLDLILPYSQLTAVTQG